MSTNTKRAVAHDTRALKLYFMQSQTPDESEALTGLSERTAVLYLHTADAKDHEPKPKKQRSREQSAGAADSAALVATAAEVATVAQAVMASQAATAAQDATAAQVATDMPWPRDWEGKELPPFMQPRKPGRNEGVNALSQLARNPRSRPDRVLMLTEHCVVAYDVYPKARLHLLVLPREPLDGPGVLYYKHAPLLRHMAELAAWLAPRLRAAHPGLPPLRCGFHAVPSMLQLHLHLVSLDFDSAEIKQPRHWIIFNTDFLVPPAKWAAELEEHGRIAVDHRAEKAKEKDAMRCPLTGRTLDDVPTLKAYVQSSAYRVAVGAIRADLVFMAAGGGEAAEVAPAATTAVVMPALAAPLPDAEPLAMTAAELSQRWKRAGAKPRSVVGFYGHTHGRYASFSNFFEHAAVEFTIPECCGAAALRASGRPSSGYRFTFSEKPIMLCKAAAMRDYATFDAVERSRYPTESKALGRSVAPFDQALWDRILCSVARHVVLTKFRAIPPLASLL
eukprot:214495-Prymnesium_polylepis.1